MVTDVYVMCKIVVAGSYSQNAPVHIHPTDVSINPVDCEVYKMVVGISFLLAAHDPIAGTIEARIYSCGVTSGKFYLLCSVVKN